MPCSASLAWRRWVSRKLALPPSISTSPLSRWGAMSSITASVAGPAWTMLISTRGRASAPTHSSRRFVAADRTLGAVLLQERRHPARGAIVDRDRDVVMGDVAGQVGAHGRQAGEAEVGVATRRAHSGQVSGRWSQQVLTTRLYAREPMFSRKLFALMVLAALGLGLPALALASGFDGSSPRAPARPPARAQLADDVGQARGRRAVPDGDRARSTTARRRWSTARAATCCSPRPTACRGTGREWCSPPGFDHGVSSEGRWTVTAAYLAPDWRSSQAPEDDFAFLTVAPRTIRGRRTEIQQITGADQLGGEATRRVRRSRCSDIRSEPNNDAITCRTKVYFTGSDPSFDCRGYVAGTSGGPWLVKAAHGLKIVGIIGGRNQGGCIDSTSYSPLLTRDAQLAYSRAAAHDRARSRAGPRQRRLLTVGTEPGPHASAALPSPGPKREGIVRMRQGMRRRIVTIVVVLAGMAVSAPLAGSVDYADADARPERRHRRRARPPTSGLT